MNNSESLNALETYFNLMCMNGGAHIFRTAGECGIFESLGQKPESFKVLAESCGLKEKPLKLLLNVLCDLKVITYNEGTYELSEVMRFLGGNYQNLSDEYWLHLKTFLETGAPIKQMDSVEQSETHYQTQVKSLEWMMTPSAMYAANALAIGSKRKALNILDIGAGSAVWSLTFASHDPEAKVTALDWPQVLKVARQSSRQRGLEAAFSMIGGNYHDVKLEDNRYDLVIIANVTHLESTEGNESLFNKARHSLKSGGELLVIDVFGDQERGRNAADLYNLGLALRTKNASIYSKEELTEMLHRSGFTTSYIPLEITPFTMGMIVAQKE